MGAVDQGRPHRDPPPGDHPRRGTRENQRTRCLPSHPHPLRAPSPGRHQWWDQRFFGPDQHAYRACLSPVRRNGARRVLRGRRRGNAPPLPDYWAADTLVAAGTPNRRSRAVRWKRQVRRTYRYSVPIYVDGSSFPRSQVEVKHRLCRMPLGSLRSLEASGARPQLPPVAVSAARGTARRGPGVLHRH